MQYELSCFIQPVASQAMTGDMEIRRCIENLETMLVRTDAGFTIELRDLKKGAQIYHSVHVGAAG